MQLKQLKTILPKKSGRGAKGQISTRHQGGRAKRYWRDIDFKRNKKDVWGKVAAIEVDPNRNARIALVVYEDGEKRYILAPIGLEVGSKVISSEVAPIDPGNALPLGKMPIGTPIHNIEIRPGKGGQMVKSAGSAATVQGKEEVFVLIKLPSGEIKRFLPAAYATVGQVGNEQARTVNYRTAGARRRMGIRPSVRGVAMHPGAHPHGGGEGRSGIGMKYPKTPSGRRAVGKTRAVIKYSDKMIVSGRKKGKHS